MLFIFIFKIIRLLKRFDLKIFKINNNKTVNNSYKLIKYLKFYFKLKNEKI